ncbi:hypothetical protein L3Q82_011578, partial [Scortum barcoo]
TSQPLARAQAPYPQRGDILCPYGQSFGPGVGSSRPPATTAIKPHCTGPSWTFLWVVSLLEGGPTYRHFGLSLNPAGPVGKDPATRHSSCEPQPQAWLQSVAQAYYTSRADLKRGIKKAKQAYKLKVEEYFVYSDLPTHVAGHPGHHLLQAQQLHTDSHECVLPQQELNDFYARFDKDNKDMIIKPKPSDDHQTLTLSPTDVQNALSQINAHARLLALMAFRDVCSELVLRAACRGLYGHLQPVTCPDSSTSVLQDHLHCASAEDTPLRRA